MPPTATPRRRRPARASSYTSLTLLATILLVAGCHSDAPALTATDSDSNQDSAPGDTLLLALPPRPLVLTTYEGSGQTVHPDFAATSAPWMHATQYLAITPYPGGAESRENPSVFTARDHLHWHIPQGATNPVVMPDPTAYLSDPDIVFDPDRNQLLLYYRQVRSQNEIYLVMSSDGVHWTPRTRVAAGYNHSIVSPAVVRRAAGDWLMWAVNAHAGCSAASTDIEMRASSDGVTWSAPQHADIGAPDGLWPWHIDVQWIPSRNEFWALYNAKTDEGCATAELYAATSPDGIIWKTVPVPVLVAGAIPEFADIVYRSTFAYDRARDEITFWFSGARLVDGTFAWGTAAQRRPRADVFDPPLAFAIAPRRELSPAARAAFRAP